MACRIILLDEYTISRIAAGEVVERPASIAKELVENSLDAGPRRITVAVEEGGRKRIVVEDDGCGMSEEEAVLALQRHATSKIRSAEDLEHITTLGFRGEALPSIAAVSRLRLTTREGEAEQGTEVVIEGGDVVSVKQVGCPPGTRLEVAALFFNTPARLKFLKSVTTEMNHLYETVTRMVLPHPGVALRLLHNEREAIVLPGTGDLLNALTVLYGPSNAQHLLPVNLQASFARISGYASSPALTRSTRAQQCFFVNGRLVRSGAMSRAVNEAYAGVIPNDRHPVVCVLIDIDPSLYDPNVHPAKTEVRFTREWEVANLLREAIRQPLVAAGHTAETRLYQVPLERPAALPTPPLAGPVSPSLPTTTPASAGAAAGREVAAAAESVPERFNVAALGEAEILGQLERTYIVARVPEGLLLLDQHAAHERVIYERLADAVDRDGQVERQGLVVPVPVTLGSQEAHVLEESLEAVGRLGFQVERFGPNAFVVRSVPRFVSAGEVERLVQDVIADLVAEKGLQNWRKRVDSLLVLVTCHSAVRRGHDLGEAEMRALLADLARTREPMVCPHGRPTLVLISSRRMAHLFRRGDR